LKNLLIRAAVPAETGAGRDLPTAGAAEHDVSAVGDHDVVPIAALERDRWGLDDGKSILH
jgi:hypothetical protein